MIVTARSCGLLQNIGIIERDCHEMPELDYHEAKSLFLNHAPIDPLLQDDFINQCVGFQKGKAEDITTIRWH